jgi:hypothetical protein
LIPPIRKQDTHSQAHCVRLHVASIKLLSSMETTPAAAALRHSLSRPCGSSLPLREQGAGDAATDPPRQQKEREEIP